MYGTKCAVGTCIYLWENDPPTARAFEECELPTKEFHEKNVVNPRRVMKYGVSVHVGDIQTGVGKGEQKANHLHRFWDDEKRKPRMNTNGTANESARDARARDRERGRRRFLMG